MIDLYKNIRQRRLQLHMTQTELAEKTGYSEKSMISRIERGMVDLPQSKIVLFANVLGTTPKALMGWTDTSDTGNTVPAVRIPVLGYVAAGVPISAIEDVLDWEEIAPDVSVHGEFFGLKIKGDSMAPRIVEGDVVIVRCQNDAESGDVVIAQVNGDSATCKRLSKYAAGISLISFNPMYPPMNYTNEEIEKLPVTIIGKVIENRQKF